MGAEDMAFILEKVPGCFFLLVRTIRHAIWITVIIIPSLISMKRRWCAGAALMAAAAMDVLEEGPANK